MPRAKSSGQIEALERQQRELLTKLKEAKAEKRTAERELRAETAKIAGAAFLDEIAENPSSDAARVLLALLDRRLSRKNDRVRFGLRDAETSVEGEAPSSAPVEAAAIGE
jgi:hypothetical protein